MGFIVYKFGLLPPTENGNVVRDQMHAAHAYRNKLTEIERERRAAHRAALSEYKDVSELEASAEDAEKAECDAINAASAYRAEHKTRKLSEEIAKKLSEARAAKREIVKLLRTRRAEVRTALAPKLDTINEEAAQKQRDARAACGVYWGTYLLIEDAAQAARKAPMFDGLEPNDPRFVCWTGEGQVGVQIQGGMSSGDLFGNDTRIRIDPVDEAAWWSPSRSERRKKSRTTLHLRVGSEGRDPIWASWPMIMHRPLPKNSVIKRVNVSLRRIGPREQWSVELTVADETELPKLGTGAVAVDLGWRVIGEEIRVAYWRAENGESGELRLPADLISGLHKPETLRATRDKAFNEMRDVVAKWLKENDAPEETTEKAKFIVQWRSQARLAALTRYWTEHRFAGDEEIYPKLEAWRYHDYHLWEWECSKRKKTILRRREIYRVFAAQLANRYRTLIIEDFDLREMAKLPKPNDESSQNQTARSNRQLASTSTLRAALVQAFAKTGELWKAPAQNTTRRCHVCGVIKKFDAGQAIEHMCPNGHFWDQDDNAAHNLLALWREYLSAEQNLVGARNDESSNESVAIQESRWARAKRLRDEKEARKGGAREAAVNI